MRIPTIKTMIYIKIMSKRLLAAIRERPVVVLIIVARNDVVNRENIRK
jgi:hypothetical protein